MSDRFSRRDFVVGGSSAALAGALAGCGGGTDSVPNSPVGSIYDLVVVGAGISGIAAARTAKSYGANVIVLEAQPHVGGRAVTDNTTFSEIGFDLGAQFFQQAISGNELLQIAQAQGLPTMPAAGTGGLTPLFYVGSTPVDTNNPLDPNYGMYSSFLAATAAIKLAIGNYGLAASGTTNDQSIATTIASFAGLPLYNLAVAQSVVGFVGSVNRSTIDLYDYLLLAPLSFATPGDDFFLKSGMGNFVASMAKGLPITLSTPVSSIATSPGNLATVTAVTGQRYLAKTVIVTASAAVLAAGGIQFTPALPAAYTQAFASLPLANIYKCLLGFKSIASFAPAVSGFSVLVPLTNNESATFFLNFWGTNTIEFVADGDLALQLETGGQALAQQTLLAELEAIFPGATANFDGRMTSSAWTTNPYTKGAYSGALPGQVSARTTAAQPISNQLWFAGEAFVSGGARGLLQGAYRSGNAAASAAMHAVGLASNIRRPA